MQETSEKTSGIIGEVCRKPIKGLQQILRMHAGNILEACREVLRRLQKNTKPFKGKLGGDCMFSYGHIGEPLTPPPYIF